MGKKTSIEWTEHTWNPWVGCTQVSPGCYNCYMFREQRRWGNDPENIRRTADRTFNSPLRWHDPAFVFTCSWSDFFIKAADEWRNAAWDIIRATPHLTYQILTKRPGLIPGRLPVDWGNGWDNVWIGVSVESDKYAWRIRELAKIAARVRFVSYEPAIGSVNWSDWHAEWSEDQGGHPGDFTFSPIDWIIVGGESGPGARDFDYRWGREAIAFGDEAGVPVFFKQAGDRPHDNGNPLKLAASKGADPSEWPAELRRREMPEAA